MNKPDNNHSIGTRIDQLIQANLENWHGKEVFFNQNSDLETANHSVIKSFQANKLRNKMITEINRVVHGGPAFHFRNHHNY
jgi:hypothetical protein